MICPLSCARCIAPGTVRVSSPFGPFTVTVLPSLSVIVTPLGTAIGAFPIRDMCLSLPDEGEELAARARLTRLTVGHQALRRGENRDPEAVAYAWHLGDTDVLAQARCGNALERADDRLSARGILEPHVQHGLPILGLDGPVILNEVVLLQDARNLGLHLRQRHVDAAVLRSAGIADPRQHVGDRIGHTHEMDPCVRPYPFGRGGMNGEQPSCLTVRLSDCLTASYQDALRTPGIIPNNASSRKQIRQSPKRRRTASERPHRPQRFLTRTWNFGFRLLFSIMALRAIAVSLPEGTGALTGACRSCHCHGTASPAP